MPSPTRRCLHLLRNDFRFVTVVEYWQSFAKKRKDVFGCIDILVIGASQIIGVQCTSGTNHGARREKILRNPAMKAWLKSGAGLWIVSFSKKGPRGKPKRWVEEIEMMKIEDFQ